MRVSPDPLRRYSALLYLVDRTYGPLTDRRVPVPASYRLWPLAHTAAVVERPWPVLAVAD
jgi:hypothetical protein